VTDSFLSFRRKHGFTSAVEEGDGSSFRQIWPNDTAAVAAFKLRVIAHGRRVGSTLSATKITLKKMYCFRRSIIAHNFKTLT
jgi:hypothetical protein